MWQAPSQRGRSSRKNRRDKSRHSIHIKRVVAELKLIPTLGMTPMVTEARVLLNDVSPVGLGLFCVDPLPNGQEVALTFDEPRRIYLRGKVQWCQEYDKNSHIMQKKSYSYRVGLIFVFESAKEEEAVRSFCEEIARDHLYPLAA